MTTPDLHAAQVAAQVEPGNAETQYSLGYIELFDGQDLDVARKAFERSIALNRFCAHCWLGLATAYQVSGDQESEARALDAALRLEPTNPALAWEVANLETLRGDSHKALRLLRPVVQYSEDGRDVDAALSFAWRISDGNVQEVLQQTVPPIAKFELTFVNILLNKKAFAEADLVWQRFASEGQPFDPALTYRYIDQLVERQKVAEATRAWDYVVKMNPSLPSSESKENLLVSGDFEHSLQSGGFGWRHHPVNGVAVSIDDSRFHSANHALLISYDSVAAPDAGVVQWVPVEASGCYEFSAMYEAGDLEGANGVQITVSDLYRPVTPLFVSKPILGSTPWQSIEGRFRTDADSKMLVIHFLIPNGTLAKGNLWLDDIKVNPLPIAQCSDSDGASRK